MKETAKTKPSLTKQSLGLILLGVLLFLPGGNWPETPLLLWTSVLGLSAMGLGVLLLLVSLLKG